MHHDEEMFGFVPRHGRLFGKGDLKYVILDLLRENPSHGYEIIRKLEDRFRGMYVPSAGAVYPTLQMLEDLGYVTVAQQDGKKVYTITEQGLGFLGEQQQAVDDTRERMRAWMRPEVREQMHELADELHGLARSFRHHMHQMDSAKLQRIREAITRAVQEIESTIES